MNRLLKRDSLVTIGGLALLAAGYFFLVFRPGAAAVSQVRRGIQSAQQQVREIPERVAHLESLQKEVERREEYLRDVMRQIPSEQELHNVVGEVTRLAKGAGFKIVRLEPLPRIPAETYEIAPFQATLTGNFDSLASFLAALEGHKRLFTVRELAISHENEKTGKVEKMDVNFAVYVIRGEKPDFSNKPDSSAASHADSRLR